MPTTPLLLRISATMPFRPWQPNFQSTPTASASHLPPASSSRSNTSNMAENQDDEDKENGSKLAQKRTKTNVPTTKRRTSKTPNMISRRNERERNRVHLLNQGFDRLRAVVPKREGEYLSKISTLKKAIWYIEHLDRVLHEESVAAGAEQASADSGVVGTGLGAGSSIGMETTSGHLDADQGQEITEGERLSPIFPPKTDESNLGKLLPFLSTTSDSGFLSGSLNASKPVQQYPPPPPVRLWTLDFEATSTPNR